MATISLRSLGSHDQPWLEVFMAEHGGAAAQVVRGEIFYPLIGIDGIPLRDEIELEMDLKQQHE